MVSATFFLWIAKNPEFDILPAEDFKLRVVVAFIWLVTHPARLHTWLDVLVGGAIYICVGIRFFVILLDFFLKVSRLRVDELVLSATSVHVELAEAHIVDSVKPDRKRRGVTYPAVVEVVDEEVGAYNRLNLRLAP